MGFILMNISDLRKHTALALESHTGKLSALSAFIGLDGFVDEIIHAVDVRTSVDSFSAIPTLAALGHRIAEAAGKSANLELVTVRTKLGGNGPIMANALATLGLQVTYVGGLGYPNLHPVFEDFSRKATVHSIAPPGHTDAIEFMDGKLMLGKHTPLAEIHWANLQARLGRDFFQQHLAQSSLVGFVNWTMIPFMSEIWESLLTELCPKLEGQRRFIFFDLADPQKRPPADIRHAMDLITRFQKHFKVILGLNENEAEEVGAVLGFQRPTADAAGLAVLTQQLFDTLKIDSLVVHPVSYAVAVTKEHLDTIAGPIIRKPVITTGAGDHFNSAFCLGKLLDLSNAACILTGVTASGYYVRTGNSPTLENLAEMMRTWPDT